MKAHADRNRDRQSRCGSAAAARPLRGRSRRTAHPKSVNIAAGHSVQSTNYDTLAHQIVFKTLTGVSCVPNPLLLTRRRVELAPSNWPQVRRLRHQREGKHLPRHGTGASRLLRTR